MTLKTQISIFLLGAGLAACATSAHPQSLEGPAAAIRAAEEVGAAGIPAAALRLQLAKEQLERAKPMTSEAEQPGAERLLLRSQADAELALAIARSTAANANAQKASDKNQTIQSAVR